MAQGTRREREKRMGVVGRIGILALACTAIAAPSLATNPPAKVTVVNKAANPVPVAGSVEVTNVVVPVEVSNADPIPVTIQGGGTASAPSEGGLDVFHRNVTLDGNQGPCVALLSVPAGRRAVVQFVSGRVSSGVALRFMRVSAVGGIGLDMYVPAQTPEIAAQAMHLYSDNDLIGCMETGDSNFAGQLTISGYFVDLD